MLELNIYCSSINTRPGLFTALTSDKIVAKTYITNFKVLSIYLNESIIAFLI